MQVAFSLLIIGTMTIMDAISKRKTGMVSHIMRMKLMEPIFTGIMTGDSMMVYLEAGLLMTDSMRHMRTIGMVAGFNVLKAIQAVLNSTKIIMPRYGSAMVTTILATLISTLELLHLPSLQKTQSIFHTEMKNALE